MVKACGQSAVLIQDDVEGRGYNALFWRSHLNTEAKLKKFWKPLGAPFASEIDTGFNPFTGRKEFRLLDKFDGRVFPSDDKELVRPVAEDFLADNRDELFGMAMREGIDLRPWGIFVFVEK